MRRKDGKCPRCTIELKVPGRPWCNACERAYDKDRDSKPKRPRVYRTKSAAERIANPRPKRVKVRETHACNCPDHNCSGLTCESIRHGTARGAA